MPDSLPLLVFPKKRDVAPPPGIPRPISQPHKPEKPRQIERIKNQISEVNLNFGRYQAEVAAGVAGLEPEVVLVLEVAGSIADFRQAVEAARLEWLGEWDVDEIAPDDDFYELNTRGERTDKPLKGRLFLSMANAAGMQELLTLWAHWENGRRLPMGKGKWADVFSQLLKIRRWDIEETLGESGMLALWETVTQPLQPDDPVTFQIELFYRASPLKRQQNQAAATAMIVALGGAVLGNSLDIEEIAFHALKASLPAYRIQELLAEVRNGNVGIALFKFSGVMYFRPTGQSLAILDSDEGFEADPIELGAVQALPPVTALLDGAPLQLHQDLQDRVIVDDIFGLEALYQPGERKHGTSMASLIVSGDQNNGEPDPLLRPIYCIPVMQPDPKSRDRREHMPDDVFFEDRIWIAVKRMFEGGKNVPAQAPDIKIINLSIGDELRPFIHEPSPWSRLIDWLSWKYKVLFCISAGNVYESLDLGMNYDAFSVLDASERRKVAIKAIAQTLSYRRVLSPAESLNAITVGASNTDDFKDAFPELRRFDLLDAEGYFSPVSRVGHGFKRTIKPEVLFPGGRQLFRIPDMRGNTNFEIDTSKAAPGQSVAWDSTTAGKLNARVFTRGTSNSSALATRAASQIHEMLVRLREQEGEDIPDSLTAVMIKALLVHGARQSESVKDELTAALKTARNGRQFKEVVSRYMGYGTPNIPRVLECAEHRATIVGGAEIKQDQIHEYEFPLPIGLASQPLWRCLIITLAWFSPVNPKHRNLREAKLQFSPSGTKWEESDLKLKRCDGDWMQVMRGTVQHEVLEGDNLISAYQDGTVLRLKVECKKDATERLDEFIPYAIAVTLEVKEGANIPIYQQIRAKIKPQIPLRAA